MIETPFLYDDGEGIEVTVEVRGTSVRVHDSGAGVSHLGRYGIELNYGSVKDKTQTDAILRASCCYGASFERGRIFVDTSLDGLFDAVQAVSESVRAMADQGRRRQTFRRRHVIAEVVALMESVGAHPQTRVRLSGRTADSVFDVALFAGKRWMLSKTAQAFDEQLVSRAKLAAWAFQDIEGSTQASGLSIERVLFVDDRMLEDDTESLSKPIVSESARKILLGHGIKAMGLEENREDILQIASKYV